MELRLLLAFVLMGVVLFTTPYFYKGVAPPKKPVTPAAETIRPATQPLAAVQKAPVPGPASIASQEEQISTIENDLYRIEFTNRGAVARSWMLKKYTDRAGKPLELVNPESAKVGLPFALYFDKSRPSADLNQALYAAKPLDNGLGITYEFSNGNVYARKTFRFSRDSYLAQLTTEVKQDGKPLPNLVQWRGGFGDLNVPNAAAAEQTVHFDQASGKLIKNQAKSAKNGPFSSVGPYSFAGLEHTYFAAAFLPENSTSLQVTVFSDSVPTPVEKKEEPFVGIAVGGEAVNRFSLFAGPKDVDILRQVNPKLEQLVDFGFFSILAKPLFLAVHWVADKFTHNYGWSIVLVTIIINFLLFPLKIANMKSMRKMQTLQPQIAVINEKYKSVGLRDPRKAQQNEEIMALYKKHGANPLGGCLPMILQIPFFIAFYKVLSVSIEMRGAHWLWVRDLSQPEHLPIRILPLAMIATQFIMQKMTPATTGDPSQQKMMMMMPLFLGFMFYGVSSGLVLYWLTGNLIGIAQQWLINRTIPAAPQPAVVKRKPTGNRR